MEDVAQFETSDLRRRNPPPPTKNRKVPYIKIILAKVCTINH